MFYRPCQGCKVTSVSVRGVPRLLTNAWNPTRWIYGDGSKASKRHYQDFSQICYDLVIFESSNHAAIGGLENSGHGEVIGAKSQVVNCLSSRHAPDVGIFEVMLWESDAQQWPFKSLARACVLEKMVQSMQHQHVDFLHFFGGQNKNHATEIQLEIIAFRNGLEAPFETLVVQLHNTPTRLVHLHDKMVQLVQICSLFSSRDLGLDSFNNSCKWKLIEFYGFRIGQELQETWVTTISKQPAMLAYFGRLSKVAGVCLLALMGSHCCVGTPLHIQRTLEHLRWGHKSEVNDALPFTFSNLHSFQYIKMWPPKCRWGAGGLVLYDASNRDWSVQHTKATAAKQLLGWMNHHWYEEMGVAWCCHRGTSFPSSWNFGVVISWISSAEMLNGEMRFQGASRVVWGCWWLWIVWFCTTLHQVEDKCIFSKKKQLHFGTSDQHIVPVICHSQQFSPGKLFAFLCNWQVQKHLLAEILRRHQDSSYAFQNGLQGDAFDTFLPILATFCMIFGSLVCAMSEEWPLTTSSARATHWQSLGMTSMVLWERSWVPMRWGLAEKRVRWKFHHGFTWLGCVWQASKCFLQRGVLPAFAVLSYCFPSIVEDGGYCV